MKYDKLLGHLPTLAAFFLLGTSVASAKSKGREPSPESMKVQILESSSGNPAQYDVEFLELPRKKSLEVKAVTASEIIQPVLDIIKKITQIQSPIISVQNKDKINTSKSLKTTPLDVDVLVAVRSKIDTSAISKLEWSVAKRAFQEIPKYKMIDNQITDQFKVPTYGFVCMELAGLFPDSGEAKVLRMQFPANELLQLNISERGFEKRYWVVGEGRSSYVYDQNQFNIQAPPLFSVSWNAMEKAALEAGRSTDGCVLSLDVQQDRNERKYRGSLKLPLTTYTDRLQSIKVYESIPGETILGKVILKDKK